MCASARELVADAFVVAPWIACVFIDPVFPGDPRAAIAPGESAAQSAPVDDVNSMARKSLGLH